MRLTFLKSAGVVIESRGTRLLCDPWLEDGAYYGSWAHVPPCDVTPEQIGPLAGIYISHIHPDHLHAATLERFPKQTPVFIHRYAWSYLADYVRELGFVPVEVSNGESVKVGALRLTIYAADNCNPFLCGMVFGCDARVGAERPGSVQIDSMAVVDDGKRSIVNVNDCPWDLGQGASNAILKRFGRPDLLLTNYVGAGPYPQCFVMPEATKLAKAAAKREQFLGQAAKYIALFGPRAFMPFAGTYTLAGPLAVLNRHRGCPTIEEATIELSKRLHGPRALHLDTGQRYDLDTGEVSGPRHPWSAGDRAFYEAKLSSRVLDYERDKDPGDLGPALKAAADRFQRRCAEVGFQTRTRVYVRTAPDECFQVPTNGGDTGPVTYEAAKAREPYLIVGADPRLLKWLLEGPGGPTMPTGGMRASAVI